MKYITNSIKYLQNIFNSKKILETVRNNSFIEIFNYKNKAKLLEKKNEEKKTQKLNKKIKYLQKENIELKEKYYKDISTIFTEFSNLTSNNKNLENTITNLTKDNENNSNELLKYKTELKDIINKYQEAKVFEEKFGIINNILKEQTKQISEYETEIKNLQHKYKEAKVFENNARLLKKQSKEKSEEIAKYEKEIAKYKAEIPKLQLNINALKETNKQLQRPLEKQYSSPMFYFMRKEFEKSLENIGKILKKK